MVRDHAGRLAASLVQLIGDFSAAEDLVQDAVVAALRRWPVEGIPERPDAWLFTVARRRGLDVLRRESNYRAKLAAAASGRSSRAGRPAAADLHLLPPGAAPRGADRAHAASRVRADDRPDRAGVPRPETTVAQRITRAKRKITDAGIPYRIPHATSSATPDRGARRDLPAVQRGLPVHRRSRRSRATWSTTPSGSPRCCTS